MRFLRSAWVRAALVLAAAAGVVAALWWRGPAWSGVADAFSAVQWPWVAAAVGLNLLSVLVRALAWRTVIVNAFEKPHPSFLLVFSAFSVGLFANAILPGRIGELARVAVLNRRMRQAGAWARLLGTVFAHRIFDLVAVIVLVTYVTLTAHIPSWATTSLIAVVVVGVVLFTLAVLGARNDRYAGIEDGLGAVRKVIRLARYGLGVMRRPASAALALL
ncbi:MAG: glycosyltransferase 2 family protein, partial [Actinomycetota bacterium]